MIAVALTIDYVLSRRNATLEVPAQAEVREPRPAPLAHVVGGFRLMDGFRYHPGHTWAVAETPELVRVGLDDFAARLTGKIASLALPSRGQWIRQGQRVLAVAGDGREYTLVSPVEGAVVDVNEKALAEPDSIRNDPYGEGWLLKVNSPDFRTTARNLLSGGLARRWMEEAADRLRAMLPAPVAVTSLDGGVAMDDLSAQLSEDAKKNIGREFFLE
ncbi:MAG TPA: glycine cleavage system protein H [Thermoanaerobaculia bacterium]